jgi:hypothetical protein
MVQVSYLFISFRFSLIQLFIACIFSVLAQAKKDIALKKKASLFVCLFVCFIKEQGIGHVVD